MDQGQDRMSQKTGGKNWNHLTRAKKIINSSGNSKIYDSLKSSNLRVISREGEEPKAFLRVRTQNFQE